jgi:NADH-quinone oxidoreductase subunit N
MGLESADSLRWYLAELTLAAGSILVLLLDATTRRKDRLGDIALLVVAGAALAVGFSTGADQGFLFHRMLVLDAFGTFFKLMLSLAAMGVIWMSTRSRELEGEHPGEYYSILLASTLGMFTMATAVNLLTAYLGLEFVSLTSYVLTGFLRGSSRGAEASLKYLLYGGTASAMMLVGFALLFGLTGTLEYGAFGGKLAVALAAPGNSSLVFLALVMVLAGFGYKIAMVPFHQWTPDVYEGAPLPIAAWLAVGSKSAGIALLVRFFYSALSTSAGDGSWATLRGIEWPTLVSVAAILTMTIGNLTALRQTSAKRLLAWSSVAHAGYMLMGFVTLSDDGLRAMLFYIVVYTLMNLGAFVVLMLVVAQTGSEDIDDLRGLAWRAARLPRWRWRCSCSRSQACLPSRVSSARFTCSPRSSRRGCGFSPRRRRSTASSASTTTRGWCGRCSSTSRARAIRR